MTSNPFEASSGLNVESEARKTVDSSWDSPFHTIGKGATQAAAGNHKHPGEYIATDGIVAGSNVTISEDANGNLVISATGTGGGGATDHAALSGRSNADQHPIAAVTGLQSALNGKSATTHTHSGFAASNHSHAFLGLTGFRAGRVGPFVINADSPTGDIIFNHGLGKTPAVVIVSPDSDGGVCSVFASVKSFSSTQIIAGMRNLGALENDVYLNWMAF